MGNEIQTQYDSLCISEVKQDKLLRNFSRKKKRRKKSKGRVLIHVWDVRLIFDEKFLVCLVL